MQLSDLCGIVCRLATVGLPIATACGGDLPAKPEGTASHSASPSNQDGVVEATASVSAQRPEFRGVVPVRVRDERLVLHGAKLDLELINPRWMQEGVWGLRLHPQRDTALVSFGGCVAKIEDNVVKFDHTVLGFYEETFDVLFVSGDWPRRARARIFQDMGQNAPFSRQPSYEKSTADYVWSPTDKRWQTTPEGPARLVLAGERFIGLKDGLLEVAGPGAPPPVQRKPSDSNRCGGASTEVKGIGLGALPSGELFVVGPRCGGPYALEMWGAGESVSSILDLPEAPVEAKLALVAPGEGGVVHLLLSSEAALYAARWESGMVQKVGLDVKGLVDSAFTARDGTLFFTARVAGTNPKTPMVSLHRLRLDGELTKSATFVSGYAGSVWAKDADTVYAESGHGIILSSKPGLRFENRAWPSARYSMPAEFILEELKPSCATPFVFLYDAADSTPAEFAYPKTVRALSSFPRVGELKLVEFWLGRRRVGVSVPSEEVAKELVTHLTKETPEEKPSVHCYEPKPYDRRDIALPKAPLP
jgi:hypothetical protein